MTYWARPWIWSFCFSLYSVFAVAASPVQLTYVSPDTKQELETVFKSAAMDFDSSLANNWDCELFGVRTGLQHETDLPLYVFKSTQTLDFSNAGVGPVKTYSLNSDKKEIFGSSGKVQDQVRRVSQKQIISKISHAESHQVLAYAKCSPAKAG